MQNLGKYEIHEQLGKGGFGTVYRATDTTLGREVALKVLHSQLVVDDTFVKRFKKEARSLASLDNHHIVTIHEFGEIDGLVFIAMQFLPGGNLKQFIANNGCVPFNQALQIMQQIGDGLTEAHEKGLIHRDLKPENILFDSRGEAVITDFGLVKDVSGTTVYSQGEILGSPNYIAPEIWSGAPASSSSDIYALGCILFEMLSGKVLFEGDSLPSIMKKHFEPLQLPTTWPIDVPKGINAVLRKALAEKLESRYQSVTELIKALSNLVSIPKLTKEKTARKPVLRNLVFTAGVLILLAAGIVIGNLLSSDTPAAPAPSATSTFNSINTDSVESSSEIQATVTTTTMVEPTMTMIPTKDSNQMTIAQGSSLNCRYVPDEIGSIIGIFDSNNVLVVNGTDKTKQWINVAIDPVTSKNGQQTDNCWIYKSDKLIISDEENLIIVESKPIYTTWNLTYKKPNNHSHITWDLYSCINLLTDQKQAEVEEYNKPHWWQYYDLQITGPYRIDLWNEEGLNLCTTTWNQSNK